MQFWVSGQVAANNGYLMELAHLNRDVAEGGEQTASSIADDGLDVAVMLLEFIYGGLIEGRCFLFEGGGEEVAPIYSILEHHHPEAASKIGGVQQYNGLARQGRCIAGQLWHAIKMPQNGFTVAMVLGR